MKIKNEYIKVKTATKEFTLRNYIYDSYLKLFSDNQKQYYHQPFPGVETVETQLDYCVIRLDIPLENYKNAEVTDFDLMIYLKNSEVSGNEIQVSTLYNYNSSKKVYDLKKEQIVTDLSEYDGRKITAIGFCGIDQVGSTQYFKVHACVDTSYYSINIDSTSNIDITRKDIISSNAVCDGTEYPLHLAPVLTRFEDGGDKYKGELSRVRAKLYSVGFGRLRGKIEDEWIIGETAEIQTINDTTYGVIMKNPIEVALYPNIEIYTSDNLYPIQPDYTRTIYPQEKMFPDDLLYPQESGYNYIIFKYRLYCNFIDNIEDLDEYYTMSYKFNPKGIFTITNRIERNNENEKN